MFLQCSHVDCQRFSLQFSHLYDCSVPAEKFKMYWNQRTKNVPEWYIHSVLSICPGCTAISEFLGNLWKIVTTCWEHWKTRNMNHWGQTPIYLAGTLRVFWEFLSNLPAIYSGGDFWMHLKNPSNIPARCIQNLPIVLISINLLGTLRTNSKWTHQFNSVGTLRTFSKKPWGFFHEFAQNAPKIYLSHSLRVLLKNAPKFVHNVPTGFIPMFWKKTLNVVQFHQKFTINSVGMWLSTLWTYCRAFFERTLNEWLRYILGAFCANLWKKPQGFFENAFNVPTDQNKIKLMVYFEFVLNVPSGLIEIKTMGIFWMCLAGILLGFFLDVFKFYSLGILQANCLKTLKKLSMCLPGKQGSAPSVSTVKS